MLVLASSIPTRPDNRSAIAVVVSPVDSTISNDDGTISRAVVV